MNNKKDTRFRVLDAAYLALMILPLVFGIVLKVLTNPPSEGISIAGARIYFTIPMPLQDFPVTESQVNSALVILVILGFCLWITHGLTARTITKRQAAAEWIVEATVNMVKSNMGEYFGAFPPFIAAIMALSAISSLLALLGL